MTNWTDIQNGQIDTDSPVTQPLMTALRDNVSAVSEGADGAPVAATGWHPYDMEFVGDGNDGVIYDFASDGGVTVIETPDFVDGYEYALFLDGITQGAGNPTIDIEIFHNGSRRELVSISIAGTAVVFGHVEFLRPRFASRSAYVPYNISDGLSTFVGSAADTFSVTAKFDKGVIETNEFITGGRIIMLRRREYFSG